MKQDYNKLQWITITPIKMRQYGAQPNWIHQTIRVPIPQEALQGLFNSAHTAMIKSRAAPLVTAIIGKNYSLSIK